MLAASSCRAIGASLLASLALSGCLSVRHTGSHPSTDGGGGISVRVFADDDARELGQAAPGGVAISIERRQGRDWVPVFRSLGASWTVLGLEPGRYQLRITGRLDEAGRELDFSERRQKVRVVEGEISEVEVVLEHVEPALVAAGVITAVVAAVLLHEWLEDHDLPTPPLPPPPDVLLDTVFHIGVELAFAVPPSGTAPSGALVTGHLPADGARLGEARPRIVFSFSVPLAIDTVEPDSIRVWGEKHGPIRGRTRYDPERWWLAWEADEDLPAGEAIHVELAAERLRAATGGGVAGTSGFAFERR